MADSATGTIATLSRVLFYATWPFVKLAHAIAYLLAPFLAVAQFLLLPLTVVVHALLRGLLFPFRLHLLDRGEVGFCN